MSRRDNIRKAKEIISSRHSEAVSTYERHTAEARENVPGFAQADSLLAQTGAKIMAAAVGLNRETSPSSDIDAIHAEYDALVRKKRAVLAENGYPEDYCDIKYHCEKCSDSGYCGIDICDCLKKEIVKASLEASGLYSLTENQNFDTFVLDYYENNDKIIMEKNLGLLRHFADTFVPAASDSFLFIGGTGLGKTHLSSALARLVIEKGAYVVYESAMMLFSDFEAKQFGRSGFSGEEPDTEKYFDCDLLIIDDLGCEMTNQFTVSCLYNIINTRLIMHKSTVISTNLSQNELRKRYTDRIISRIFGEYKPLIFTGSDVREQKIRREYRNSKL